MDQTIYEQLTNYYLSQGIHPEHFNCSHRAFCRQFALDGMMTEAKMSLVGTRLGQDYPRIVVLSLDPPLGENGKFTTPAQRTTGYVTSTTEKEDYTINRPNVHWAMTQIIVKDILCLFGFKPQPYAAVVSQSYSGRPIQNVSRYFAHVNVAKCSMNKGDKGQADFAVHKMCSNSHLLKELNILQPDILISQGKNANSILAHLIHSSNFEIVLPAAKLASIGSKRALWLPMDHPARHIAEIRQRWPFYVGEIQKWAKDRPSEMKDHQTIESSQEEQSVETPNLPSQSQAKEFTPKKIDSLPVDNRIGQSNLGLYICQACGKTVLGFDRVFHIREVHQGKDPGFEKIEQLQNRQS